MLRRMFNNKILIMELSLDNFKEKLISELVELRKEELLKISGGLGCSGKWIGCGPGYCVGDCPANCLSHCMAQFQDKIN